MFVYMYLLACLDQPLGSTPACSRLIQAPSKSSIFDLLIHQGNVPKSKTTGKLCDYLGIMSNVGGSNAHSWRSPIWSLQIRVALNFKTAKGYFTHRSLKQDSHK